MEAKYIIKRIRVFVGASQHPDDVIVFEKITKFLRQFHLVIDSGNIYEADKISSQIKNRIKKCDLFTGILTRRYKLESKMNLLLLNG